VPRIESGGFAGKGVGEVTWGNEFDAEGAVFKVVAALEMEGDFFGRTLGKAEIRGIGAEGEATVGGDGDHLVVALEGGITAHTGDSVGIGDPGFELELQACGSAEFHLGRILDAVVKFCGTCGKLEDRASDTLEGAALPFAQADSDGAVVAKAFECVVLDEGTASRDIVDE
jgi:hypothetical protein